MQLKKRGLSSPIETSPPTPSLSVTRTESIDEILKDTVSQYWAETLFLQDGRRYEVTNPYLDAELRTYFDLREDLPVRSVPGIFQARFGEHLQTYPGHALETTSESSNVFFYQGSVRVAEVSLTPEKIAQDASLQDLLTYLAVRNAANWTYRSDGQRELALSSLGDQVPTHMWSLSLQAEVGYDQMTELVQAIALNLGDTPVEITLPLPNRDAPAGSPQFIGIKYRGFDFSRSGERPSFRQRVQDGVASFAKERQLNLFEDLLMDEALLLSSRPRFPVLRGSFTQVELDQDGHSPLTQLRQINQDTQAQVARQSGTPDFYELLSQAGWITLMEYPN